MDVLFRMKFGDGKRAPQGKHKSGIGAG